MMFLPVCINIADKKILVVGGGKVALEKINSLKRFTGQITIIAREADKKIREYKYPVIDKSYEKADLDGFFLVYACTDSPETNRQIKKDCEKKGILVNVADNPGMCGFISPAIYKKDNMTVAVSSNGEDVLKSIEWRDKIRTLLDGTVTL